ncbi:Ring finger domain-containing protein [Rutstroemia sp. NJR-2017a WRK4]|nr:Ring finger domain-containing protein [Rutstroemia sp. NJR-2017a WRK4]
MASRFVGKGKDDRNFEPDVLSLDDSHFGLLLDWGDLLETQECVVCSYSLPLTAFPMEKVTVECEHRPSTCLECLQRSIAYDHRNKVWDNIRCPEDGCFAPLSFQDVRKYADGTTFKQSVDLLHGGKKLMVRSYEQLSLQAALPPKLDFVWCLRCSSGQYHEGTALQPIVKCHICNTRFCFNHQVPWHEGLSCEEYSLQSRSKQPVLQETYRNCTLFRSMVIRGLTAKVSSSHQHTRLSSKQGILVGRRAEQMLDRSRRDEESASIAKVKETTKLCPGCSCPIEKNNGCDHMRSLRISLSFFCRSVPLVKIKTERSRVSAVEHFPSYFPLQRLLSIRCRHEFCYECLADYHDILILGNSVHAETCIYHSNNLVN